MAIKNAIPLLLLLLVSVCIQAQQDPVQSMYLNDKLLFNPAYAGSRENIAMTMQYRHQWAGLDGAPRTMVFSGHAPLKKERLSLGGTVYTDRLGVTQETGITGSYAYRLPAGPGKLSMGIDAGFIVHRTTLSEVLLIDEVDALFTSDEKRVIPKAGFGLWYQIDNAFASFSIPNLLRSAYTPQGASKTERHYYLGGGYVHTFNDKIKLRPMGLWKYSEGGLGQLDINVSAELMQVIWLGTGYRTGGAGTAQMEVYLKQGIGFGYAYDFDFSELSKVSNGSHEVYFRYDLPIRGKAVLSPRGSSHRYF